MAETVEELLDRRQEAVEQAARFGQQLLEEKRELVEELERRQQECASLREVSAMTRVAMQRCVMANSTLYYAAT